MHLNLSYKLVFRYKKGDMQSEIKYILAMAPSLRNISVRGLLFLSYCITLVTADLTSDLSSLNFTVLVPGNSGYSSASAACELLYSSIFTSANLFFIQCAVNRRFTFQPSAIFFPTTAQDVSSAIKLAVKYDHNVVARSGAHSYIANGLGGRTAHLSWT